MQNPGQNPNQHGTVEEQLQAQKLLPDVMRKNVRQIDLMRIVLYIAVGCIAGICGLTGLKGFMFYVASTAVVTIILAASMGFDSKTYTNESIIQIFFGNLSGQIMSFIMFWTLAYSLVYVY